MCCIHFSNFCLLLFSGTVRSLHRSQHSCFVHWMRIPAIHVPAAASQLNHIFRSLHELLHPELPEEEATRSEKS